MKKHTADPNHHNIPAYILLILSAVLGQGSLLIMTIFLFSGSLNIVDMGMEKTANLGFDAFLCLMFFLQHSLMIRKSFRQWLTKIVRPEYYTALFSVVSGIVLLMVIVFWQKTGLLIEFHQLISWSLYGTFFLSVMGLALTSCALKGIDPFGYSDVWHYMRGTTPEVSLRIQGTYRWVRHPLYFFLLVLIWSCPNLTADRLLFNILWTIWMIIGTILEERDLVAAFGDEYRAYQREVPMLIPYRISLFRKPAEDQ